MSTFNIDFYSKTSTVAMATYLRCLNVCLKSLKQISANKLSVKHSLNASSHIITPLN